MLRGASEGSDACTDTFATWLPKGSSFPAFRQLPWSKCGSHDRWRLPARFLPCQRSQSRYRPQADPAVQSSSNAHEFTRAESRVGSRAVRVVLNLSVQGSAVAEGGDEPPIGHAGTLSIASPVCMSVSTNASTIGHVVRGLMKQGRMARLPLTTVVLGKYGVSRRSLR